MAKGNLLTAGGKNYTMLSDWQGWPLRPETRPFEPDQDYLLNRQKACVGSIESDFWI